MGKLLFRKQKVGRCMVSVFLCICLGALLQPAGLPVLAAADDGAGNDVREDVIISKDTVWSKQNSLIDCILTIEQGCTLELERGLSIHGNVAIQGPGTLKRSWEECEITVAPGGHLTMKDLILDGQREKINEGRHPMLSGRNCDISLECCIVKDCRQRAYAVSNGGAINIYGGKLTLTEVTMENCDVEGEGGGIYAQDSQVIINSGDYQNNTSSTVTVAKEFGGGFLYIQGGKLEINGGTFRGNKAGNAGCINALDTEVRISDGTFSGNVSTTSYRDSYGSGAIHFSTTGGPADFHLSGGAVFAGMNGSGTDGIHLDHDPYPSKIHLSSPLGQKLDVFLAAGEKYVVVEGEDYTLSEEDRQKLSVYDVSGSGKNWKTILDQDRNCIYLTDPDAVYITYDSNGAEGKVTDEQDYVRGANVMVKPAEALACQGYEFTGWNTKSDGTGSFYKAGDVIKGISESLTLYAIFEKTVTASFYSGPDSMPEQKEIKVNQKSPECKVTVPALQEWKGWEPLGWTSDSLAYQASVSENEKVPLAENCSYYGIYRKKVTLSYDANGGEHVPDSGEGFCYVNVHNPAVCQPCTFTVADGISREDGYYFLRWDTKKDGTGMPLKPQSQLELEEDAMLYAQWTAENEAEYTVEHYLQEIVGAGYQKADSDTEKKRAAIGAEVMATPGSYRGFTENKVHPARTASGVVEADGSLVLKLYYDRNIYEVDFDLNGGEGVVPEKQTVRYQGLVQEPEPPVRGGYRFQGWYHIERSEKFMWDFSRPVEYNTSSEHVILCAQWEEIPRQPKQPEQPVPEEIFYEISFDLNGGAGTPPEKQTVRLGQCLAPVDEPARTGYSFRGWYREKDGKGNPWDFQKPVEENTVSRKVILYAGWRDDIAPVLGTPVLQTSHKNVAEWMICREEAVISIPVTEEGSGIKQAEYVLIPKSAQEPAESLSVFETLPVQKAEIVTERGKSAAKIHIVEEFQGNVVLVCRDYAGNRSQEKYAASEKGGIILENHPPEISFSSDFQDSKKKISVRVDIRDDRDPKGGNRITGGIASVSYQLDDGKTIAFPEEKFDGQMAAFCSFQMELSGEQEHLLKVTAVDHAGNAVTCQTEIKPENSENPSWISVGNEPGTGETAAVEIYGKIAVLAGILLLFFSLPGISGTSGRSRMH